MKSAIIAYPKISIMASIAYCVTTTTTYATVVILVIIIGYHMTAVDKVSCFNTS